MSPLAIAVVVLGLALVVATVFASVAWAERGLYRKLYERREREIDRADTRYDELAAQVLELTEKLPEMMSPWLAAMKAPMQVKSAIGEPLETRVRQASEEEYIQNFRDHLGRHGIPPEKVDEAVADVRKQLQGL